MRVFVMMLCVVAGGCVFNRPDHFYALHPAGGEDAKAQSSFSSQVNLHVSLPIMVDRSEMVLTGSGGITILEHERWAAPLAEQFSNILGQDIESRRPDVIVASRGIAQPDAPATTITVDVVQLSLQEHVGTRLEVRWRSQQRGGDVAQARETFITPAQGTSYEELVQSLNTCIGALADRLVAQLPR